MSSVLEQEAPAGAVDPAAPHGRRKDGTPARKRGPKGPRAGLSGPAASRRRPAPKPKAPDFRPALTEIGNVLGAGVGLFLPADGAAIQMYAEPLADGVNEIALMYPQFAALLEKITPAGPALKIGVPLFGLTVQLMHNHGMIPTGQAVQLGAVPKETLEAELRRRGEEIARQAQEAAETASPPAPAQSPPPAPAETYSSYTVPDSAWSGVA